MRRIPLLFALFVVLCTTGMTDLFAQPFPPPQSPVNFRAEVVRINGAPKVKLFWQRPQHHNPNFRFDIYRKQGGIQDTGTFNKIKTGVIPLTYLDLSVQTDVRYSYFVAEVNPLGVTANSDTLEVVAAFPPPPVPAIVNGFVIDDGTQAAIGRGTVKLIPVPHGMGKVVPLDSNGYFKAQVLPGTYMVHFSAMGYRCEYFDNAATPQNATQLILVGGDSITINASLAALVPPVVHTLSGSVTDASGAPQRARLEVFKVRLNTFNHFYRGTFTDSLGNYSVPVKAGDTLVIFAKPMNPLLLPEYYDNQKSFQTANRIPVNGDVTGINFVLEEKPVYPNGIAGQVTDSNGTAVMAHIVAIPKKVLPTPGNNHPRRYATHTDSLGNYSFSNLVPREYILLALPENGFRPTYFRYDGTCTMNWRQADSVVVDSATTVTGINFFVKPINNGGTLAVSGKVFDGSGAPVSGAIVVAYDQDQQIAGYGITTLNGAYMFDELTEGTYTIGADLAGYQSSSSVMVNLNYGNQTSGTASFTLSPDGVTGTEDAAVTITGFELSQNYPNPFNPTTRISYQVMKPEHVTIKVYSVLGKEVATLVDGFRQQGVYTIDFNAQDLASGVYFYQMKAGNFTAAKKLTLLR